MDNFDVLHSRSPSEASMVDDVEMVNIDTVIHKLDSPRQDGHRLPTSDDLESSDDGAPDIEHEDESHSALLGSHERTGQERQFGNATKTWLLIRGIVLETGPTLLFTTVSILFTGRLLDRVSQWRAMKQINELIMIIPVILNLKGNLEMNLSARLGTAANVGELDKPETLRTIILGNLLLLQVQATVVSFVATCVSFILGLAVPDPTRLPATNETSLVNSTASVLLQRYATYPRHPRPYIPVKDGAPKSGIREFVMVASTSMSAACLSSLLLGSFMCFLVVLCRRFGRDPDNIAPPVASCLGDLVTLSFVGLVSALLIQFINTPIPLVLGIIVVLTAVTCATFTLKNPVVRPLIRQGWSPLFGAMIISSGTGIVLDLFVNQYEGFALLAVAISGLPGNVGSILVSRLSTALHAAALSLPVQVSYDPTLREPQNPSPKLVMITLMLVTLPVQIIFLAVLHALGWLKLPFIFIAFALLFFCCAVAASLFIARILTAFLWSKGLDPDIYALPIHSSLMDLIGQLLLVLCFETVSRLGTRVTNQQPRDIPFTSNVLSL